MLDLYYNRLRNQTHRGEQRVDLYLELILNRFDEPAPRLGFSSTYCVVPEISESAVVVIAALADAAPLR